MHYGWPITMDFLFDYAEKHDLIQYEQSLDVGDDPDDNDYENPKIITTVDRYASAREALRHNAVLAGGRVQARKVKIATVVNEKAPVIVSLFTNYTLKHAKADDFKKSLCEKLQLKGEPRWYLDDYIWEWRAEYPDCLI